MNIDIFTSKDAVANVQSYYDKKLNEQSLELISILNDIFEQIEKASLCGKYIINIKQDISNIKNEYFFISEYLIHKCGYDCKIYSTLHKDILDIVIIWR